MHQTTPRPASLSQYSKSPRPHHELQALVFNVRDTSRPQQWPLISERRVQELLAAQPVAQGAPQRVRFQTSFLAHANRFLRCAFTDHLFLFLPCSIKKPKTSRYPSLKGTDPKFRRNHRHALHGTMKALVRIAPKNSLQGFLLHRPPPRRLLTSFTEGAEGGQARDGIDRKLDAWLLVSSTARLRRIGASGNQMELAIRLKEPANESSTI
ncbi:60S ribosomal protein L29 [Colletotrichum cuscutae]|uniref:60S ribosomal protein L29 n=1 Tax=Colletotrichum cuscutae TaxID=1209917 RepID=A0AAI9UTC5_9PEZI|nr:60S ribosomal protein L29 [Colletotrichum cuscutae]